MSEESVASLLPGFMNCARHCWCAYSPNHELIRNLGAEVLVELMKRTPHIHGTDPEKCTGCLREAGKITY